MSSIRGVRRIRFNGLKLNFGSTSLRKNKSGPTTPSCKPADGHKANFLDTPIQKPSTPIGIATRTSVLKTLGVSEQSRAALERHDPSPYIIATNDNTDLHSEKWVINESLLFTLTSRYQEAIKR